MSIMTKEQQKDLVKLTDTMIEAAKDQSAQWATIYADGLNYLLDNQLADKVRGEGWAPVQINRVFPAIMQDIASQNSRKLKIVAEPWGDEDQEGAEIWSEMLQWQYMKGLKFDRVRMAATLDTKITGICLAKVYWDEYDCWDDEKKEWQGALKVSLIRPQYLGIDPEAECYDDAEYVFVRRAVPLQKAQRLYPKFKKQLADKARETRNEMEKLHWLGSYESDQIGYEDNAQDDESYYLQHLQRLVDVVANDTSDREKYDDPIAPEYVVLTEIYFRDYTMTKYEKKQPYTKEDYPPGTVDFSGDVPRVKDAKFFKEKGKKVKKGDALFSHDWPEKVVESREEPKYPYGRMIVRADDLILNPETDDQRYPYKKWPLIMGRNLPLPHNPRGLNGIELARGMQDVVNVIAASMTSYAMLCGNPITLVEQGAIPQDPENQQVGEHLPRRPGAVWKTAANGGNAKIDTLDPPRYPQENLQIFQEFRQSLQDTMANPDIAIGRDASHERSAAESVQLAENASTRQGLPGKLLDEWMIEIFELATEILKKKLKPEQWVRVIGEEGGDRATRLASSDISAKFDLKLDIEDIQPFSRQLDKQDALAVYQAVGPVSPTITEWFLEAYDVPNKRQAMQDLAQAQQAQAQAAQQESITEQEQYRQENDLKRQELAFKMQQERNRDKQKGQNDGKK